MSWAVFKLLNPIDVVFGPPKSQIKRRVDQGGHGVLPIDVLGAFTVKFSTTHFVLSEL